MLHAYRVVVGFVRCFEMAAHQEGLIAVLLFHPSDGFLGDEAGGEAKDPFAELVVAGPRVGALYESRVTVFALIVEDGVVVESLRLRLDMPFADESGVVSVGLQQGGKGGDGGVQ